MFADYEQNVWSSGAYLLHKVVLDQLALYFEENH